MEGIFYFSMVLGTACAYCCVLLLLRGAYFRVVCLLHVLTCAWCDYCMVVRLHVRTAAKTGIPGLHIAGLNIPGLSIAGLNIPGLSIAGLSIADLNIHARIFVVVRRGAHQAIA